MNTPRALLSLLLLATACSGSSEPAPIAPEAPEPSTPEVAPPDKAAAAPASPEPASEPQPLPPGASMEGYPKVALVGFGLRFELNPPFQAARMAGLIEKDNPHVLFVSWWDVNAEGAGRHGRAGLYNVGVVPRALPEGATEYRPVEVERNGLTTIALRLGETGTELRLPEGISGLGGMGSATVGPNTDEWRIQVGDDAPLEWPEEHMLHSGDPASKGAVFFDKMPSRPHGPWKEASPAP